VRLAALDLRENPGGGSRDLRVRNGEFRNSQVSLKFTGSHFLHEYHLSV